MPKTLQLKDVQFSGPLDLLLSLLAEKKLTITELSLSEVTEQYLMYLDTLEENRADELADFLVIGSKLLFLKSRALLPQFSPEEDEGSSLEDQLRLYKAFQEVSKKVNRLWENPHRSITRIEPPRRRLEFAAPVNLSCDGVRKCMLQLINRLKPLKPLPETRIDKAVSMKEKIDRIREFLKKRKQLNFHEVLQNSRNKTDVIVSFLALLELVKQKTVSLRQGEAFGDIVIKSV